MRDFSLTIYKNLLHTLRDRGYRIHRVDLAPEPGDSKFIILRHDVDWLPLNALKMAKLESEMGIRSSYYFRTVPQSFDESVIREIFQMNHEVGYHYENLSTVVGRRDFRKIEFLNLKSQTKSQVEGVEGAKPIPEFSCLNSPDTCDLYSNSKLQIQNPKQSQNQNVPNLKDQILNDPEMKLLFELAIEDFDRNLYRFREIVPVKTICMHGSPLSKIDNRDLWKVYDYRDFGIIGEPYFDVDFSKVLYLTDTGRRWDGERYNVRDKEHLKSQIRNPKYETIQQIQNSKPQILNPKQIQNSNVQNPKKVQNINNAKTKVQNLNDQNVKPFSSLPRLHSTFDVIEALEKELLPDRIMINTHPQRWTDNTLLWVKELVWQNLKNVIKKYYVK